VGYESMASVRKGRTVAIAYRSKARRGVISVRARRTMNLRRVLRYERRRPAAVVAIWIPVCVRVSLAGLMDVS